MDSGFNSRLSFRGMVASASLWFLPSLDDSKDHFRIRFQSTQQDFEKEFERQMDAVKSIWIARLVGKSSNGEVTLSLEFPGEHTILFINTKLLIFLTTIENSTKQKTSTLAILKYVFIIYRENKNSGSKLMKLVNIFRNTAEFTSMMGGFASHIMVCRKVTG